jgi:hypothetical protein
MGPRRAKTYQYLPRRWPMPDQDMQLTLDGEEVPVKDLPEREPDWFADGEQPANLEPGTYDPATVPIPF